MSQTPNGLPAGFQYAGVACGIKESGKADLSLIVADRPVVAAGVYTQNQVVAAPVVWSRGRTPSMTIRAVVTNSGNANACTGDRGTSDTRAMAEQVAELVSCQVDDVLVMSTGVIGQHLPMSKLQSGIPVALASLRATTEAFDNAAEAICTTDKTRKTAHRQVVINDDTYRVAAMAKGAGMIAPNMATLLAVVLTDAPLASETAQALLARVADQTFNRISVDGHTSTNDTLLLLSSGTGNPLSDESIASLESTIQDACLDLAKLMVADGEGASHFMACRVSGAKSDHEARLIAETVTASPLVKTAIAGNDPNWGRIVSAAGYAKATLNPELTSLKICGVTIYQDGDPCGYDAKALSQLMSETDEIGIELAVGDGPGSDEVWASDLTTDYVQFNSEYTT